MRSLLQEGLFLAGVLIGVVFCWLQAHFINNRTMEIFRDMRAGKDIDATLASQVAEASPPLSEWRKFIYCETVTGRVFGEVDHFKAGYTVFPLYSSTAVWAVLHNITCSYAFLTLCATARARTALGRPL